MANAQAVLEALLPNPTVTRFPIPRLVTSSGPAGSFTSESFMMGGVLMPGQWLLTSCPRVYGWQIQQQYAMSGATVVPIGDPLLKAKFKIKIWTSADAGLYRQLLKTTLRKPVGLVPGSTTSAGLGIDQPQLNDVGVTSVVVWSVTPLMNPLVESGGRGAWTAECELLEYRQPIPALPKPSQTIPVKKTPAPTAQDAADVEIQKLSQVFGQAGSTLATQLTGGPKP